MKSFVFMGFLAAGVVSGHGISAASESLAYQCNLGDGFAFVQTIPEEGRAVYQGDTGNLNLVPDGRGGYFNDREEVSFADQNGQPALYLGDVAFACQLAAPRPTGSQTHAGGAVGGNETRLNAQGQSLGGKLRDGPGMNFRQTGSLAEGTWITILTNTGVRFNGYDWFEVATDRGQRGFQWGGIMCSNGQQLAGIFEQCGARSVQNPQQAANAAQQLNVQGQSLGGKLRGGPGTNYAQVGSLTEGTWVTILRNTGVRFDGYDWFEVATDRGQRGFQWGGIMCSNGQQISGIYQQCGSQPPQQPVQNRSTGSAGGWMAFALAPNGAYGHGAAPTQAGAEQFAMNYCGGPQCRIADTTQARCHALAIAPGSNGIGAGESEQAAQGFAMGWCANNGASNCRIEYTYCQ